MAAIEQQFKDEAYYTKAITTALRIGFVGLLIVLSYLILKPFLFVIMWGIIIAVGIYPLFKKFAALLGNRKKLASTIITLFALALLIVPSYFLMESAIGGIQNLARELEEGTFKVPPPSEDVAEWPLIGKPVYDAWKLASVNLEGAIKTFEPQIKEFASNILSGILGLGSTVLLTIVSIIIAGALMAKAESAEIVARKAFKILIGKKGEGFTELAGATIRSVVQGVLGVAIIQSVVSGIVMLIFNIPLAGLWALIVLFFAIIQLPPLIILLPIAVYSFSILDTTSAIIFLVMSIIISMSDAFLKPIFLGRGVDVPTLVILLGAIGGMMLAGVIGLFVGAVILALAYKVYQALLEDTSLPEEDTVKEN
ncbi:MAG: AI-2E family transporter [Ignavibacteriaceae bacterium]|nr:AI-2E family transporter [Ignavibacteriaceae bacterium]